MSNSKRTTDHSKIRRWAEARDGKPACVRSTGGADDVGLLRAFVYQEKAAAGEPSRFDKFVSR
jgi:hypothetical protein